LENCSAAIRFVQSEGLKLVGIGPEGMQLQILFYALLAKYLFFFWIKDLVDPKLKLILGLIWTIILRYQIQKGRGKYLFI